tara:strand:- start:236 stop:667 length:432 start_codon:yes stop_codon:yes gene_type:complete
MLNKKIDKFKIKNIKLLTCSIHRITLIENKFCYKCEKEICPNKLKTYVNFCEICKKYLASYEREYCRECFMCNCGKYSRFPGICKWCYFDTIFNKKIFLKSVEKYPDIFFGYLLEQSKKMQEYLFNSNTEFEKHLIEEVLNFL